MDKKLAGRVLGSYGTIDNTTYVPKVASSTLSVRATKSSDHITNVLFMILSRTDLLVTTMSHCV